MEEMETLCWMISEPQSPVSRTKSANENWWEELEHWATPPDMCCHWSEFVLTSWTCSFAFVWSWNVWAVWYDFQQTTTNSNVIIWTRTLTMRQDWVGALSCYFAIFSGEEWHTKTLITVNVDCGYKIMHFPPSQTLSDKVCQCLLRQCKHDFS